MVPEAGSIAVEASHGRSDLGHVRLTRTLKCTVMAGLRNHDLDDEEVDRLCRGLNKRPKTLTSTVNALCVLGAAAEPFPDRSRDRCLTR